MKIFTQKNVLQKLILILMIFTVFNAVLPSNVSCAFDENQVGGKLMKPIMDFLLALGDFIMDLIHNVIYDMNTALIRIDLNLGLWEFLAIAAVVIAVAVLVFAAGAALVAHGPALLAALGKVVGLTVAVASEVPAAAVGAIIVATITGGAAAGVFARSSWFSDEAVLPLYQITPEEIFTGQVELLNPNFFSDKSVTIGDMSIGITNKNQVGVSTVTIKMERGMYKQDEEQNKAMNNMLKSHGYTGSNVNAQDYRSKSIIAKWNNGEKAYQAEATVVVVPEDSGVSTYPVGSSGGSKIVTVTVYSGEWKGSVPIAQSLKNVIAKWYYNIRNIALVAMMVILIYIGIRIMFCGISSQKAKYKNMFFDWLVAICLMFVMHYIMVFAMNTAESVISVFSSMNNDKEYIATIVDEDGKIKKELKRAAGELGYSENDINAMYDGNTLTWDAKNIMGLVRVTAAQSNSGTYIYMGYVLSFLILVWYTLFFLVTYIKRILYLAFFTIISPFVAMTYPLDKIHDGKAQAFDMWIKEYVINLLIPIIHTVLYTVLINSAFELASSNIIYTLVAIGFMLPAEKFVRKMFGFDKAQTPGFLGGAAGAAVALTAFNNILKPRKSLTGKENNSAIGGNEKGKDKLKTKEDFDPTAIMGVGANAGAIGSPTNPARSLTGGNRGRQIAKAQARAAKANANSRTGATINFANSSTRSLAGNINPNIPLKKNYKKAIEGASKDWARQKLQRAANSLSSGQPIRSIARTARGLYLGAGAATLGATLGIAAEDPSKVLQYGGTLGAAAYAIGSRDTKNIDEESIYEEYQRGLYGEEYERAQLEAQRKQIIENEKNLKELRNYLNLNDLASAKEVLEKHGDCIDAGIGIEDIATIEKLTNDGKMDKEMAKSAYKFHKKAGGKPSDMGPKEKEKVREIFSNVAKSNGITEQEQIDVAVDNMMKHIDTYGKYKGSLNDIK